MIWTIEFERAAAREFSSLDDQAKRQIRNFFKQQILPADQPLILGKPLRGKQANLWRYRIGSYRVVADLQDHRLVILIVRVGHRGAVYKNQQEIPAEIPGHCLKREKFRDRHCLKGPGHRLSASTAPGTRNDH